MEEKGRALQTRIDGYEESTKKLNGINDGLSRERDDKEKTLQEKLGEILNLGGEIKELNGRVTSLQGEVSEYKQSTSALTTEKGDLEKRIGELQEAGKALQARIDVYITSTQKLNGINEGLIGERDDKEKTLQQKLEEILKLNGEIKKLNGRVISLQGEVSTYGQSIKALTTEKEVLGKKLSDAQRVYEEKVKIIADLEADVKKYTQDLEREKNSRASDLSKEDKKIQGLNRTIEEVKADKQGLEERIREKEGIISQRDGEIEKLQKLSDSLKETYEKQEQDLENQLKAAQEYGTAKDGEIVGFKALIKQSGSQIHNLTDKLCAAQKGITNYKKGLQQGEHRKQPYLKSKLDETFLNRMVPPMVALWICGGVYFNSHYSKHKIQTNDEPSSIEVTESPHFLGLDSSLPSDCFSEVCLLLKKLTLLDVDETYLPTTNNTEEESTPTKDNAPTAPASKELPVSAWNPISVTCSEKNEVLVKGDDGNYYQVDEKWNLTTREPTPANASSFNIPFFVKPQYIDCLETSYEPDYGWIVLNERVGAKSVTLREVVYIAVDSLEIQYYTPDHIKWYFTQQNVQATRDPNDKFFYFDQEYCVEQKKYCRATIDKSDKIRIKR